MLLKRLELVGFKSFVAKTALDFPSGITAVVGPNGSGKSNIIDAIRWLLGEREAKNMRGLKAEDLIFAGNPERARVSVAQATIVFDNGSHFFPVDFGEVAVRRRIERDGTSSYFLNDAEVRLKDVIDFFAQSRLGTKGFSIVNQGDSDLFVRSAPRERRAMLEEILGLRQFQLKKHDAELKLKNTSFNMEKVRALIEEIVPHLRVLRRQTAKWEKHDELANELHVLEEHYFGAKIYEIDETEKGIKPEREKLEFAIAVKEKELKSLQSALQKVQSDQPKTSVYMGEWEKEKQALAARRAKLERELGRLEAQIEMADARPAAEASAPELLHMLEETRETIEDALYETDLKRIRNVLKLLFEKINHLLDAESHSAVAKDRHHELEGAQEEARLEIIAIDKKLKELNMREGEVTAGLKEFNENFRHAFEAVEVKRGEIGALTAEGQKILFEVERLRLRREELGREAERVNRRLSEFKNVAVPADFDLLGAERRILRLRGELAGIGEVDDALIKEAKEMETRHEFLSAQMKDLEKAHHDLTELVRDLDRKIHDDFTKALRSINEEFNNYFRMMFGGGQAKLILQKVERDARQGNEENSGNEIVMDRNDENKEEQMEQGGIDISVSIPRKRIAGLDMLSGGEKTLVSIAALFALISVSPPPFLVLDEIDAALDEPNTRRFANLIKNFAKKTQFVLVTHNRATMEAADTLYGITMGEDGTSRVLSLKLEYDPVPVS